MRKNSCEFQTSFISEAGTFRSNKDYFAFVELDDMACWIAADGIDSDEEIESAQIAANSIFADFMDKPTLSRRRLKKFIMNAQQALKAESRNVRLKASIIVVVTDYSKIIWAVAGNARLYHFRKGRFNFRSKDQSVAQMMADTGKIGQDDISTHEEKHNLINYLGKPKDFKPFISQKYNLMDGDIILLSTPGFWEMMDNIELVDAIKDVKEPAELVDTLEEMFLTKQKKVISNYTVASVYCNKVFKETPKDNKRIIKRVAAILIPVLIVGAVAFGYRQISIAKAKDAFTESINSGNQFSKDGSFDKALNEYDEAKNSLKKFKDKEKETLLQRKIRITQLIVDGDNYLKEKDFINAKDNFIKARSEAEYDEDCNKQEIEERISKAQNFINASDLEKEGDDLAVAKNYKGAVVKYKSALAIAEEYFFYDMKKEIEKKISDAQAADTAAAGSAADKAKKEKELQDLLKECEAFEKDGKKNLLYGQNDKAKINYEMALERYMKVENYKDLDSYGKIVKIQIPNKIKEIREIIVDVQKKIDEEKEKQVK